MNHCVRVALLFAALSFATPARADSCKLKLLTSLDMVSPDDPRVLVPGAINGMQAKFLVDTGGGVSTVTKKTVETLKLASQEADGKLLDLYGHASDRYVRLDTLQLGLLKAKNMHLMIDTDRDREAEFDGLIAGDILDNYDVELNFVTRKLNLFSQDHCEGQVVYWPATAGTVVPFSMKRPMRDGLYVDIGHDTHIRIPVTLDGKQVQAIIDTGAASTVMSAGVADAVFDITAASPGAIRSDGHQEFGYIFHDLSFGGISVANPHVVIFPDLVGTKDPENASITGSMIKKENDGMQTEFIIGMNILSRLHLYIAYGEKKLYITPPDQPAAAAKQ